MSCFVEGYFKSKSSEKGDENIFKAIDLIFIKIFEINGKTT